MRLQPWIAGLLALILTTVPMFAQGLSQALPVQSVAAEFMPTAQDVTAAGTFVSSVFTDPIEIKSLEYDATTNVSLTAPTVKISYSNTLAGPFVDGATYTFTNTPTSGSEVAFLGYKYAKLTLTNTGGMTTHFNRLTGLRMKIGPVPRPQALVDQPYLMDYLAGTIAAAGDSGVVPTNPIPLPGEFTYLHWATTGGAGEARTLYFYYSNNKNGPYVAWEDLTSGSYVNSVAATTIDKIGALKAHVSLFCKVKFAKAAGADMVVTSVATVRRKQDAK